MRFGTTFVDSYAATEEAAHLLCRGGGPASSLLASLLDLSGSAIIIIYANIPPLLPLFVHRDDSTTPLLAGAHLRCCWWPRRRHQPRLSPLACWTILPTWRRPVPCSAWSRGQCCCSGNKAIRCAHPPIYAAQASALLCMYGYWGSAAAQVMSELGAPSHHTIFSPPLGPRRTI